MPRPQDWIGRHAQPRRSTASGVRSGGAAFPASKGGRNDTWVAAWDASLWNQGVFGAGGRLIWDDSDWGAGDTFPDETTGEPGHWDYSYWRRCQFCD